MSHEDNEVPSTKLTGGDAVVLALEALGVTDVFGIVSVHNLPIYDAIERRQTIRPIRARHEQGAAHAADGYARATGRLGVVITSTGPGAANAVPGLFEAGFASSPVLMITGQIDSIYYGKGRGYLHEAERQMAMLGAVSRRAETVRRSEDIAHTIVSVGDDVLTGRPQPGVVEIPIDLQYRPTRVEVPSRPGQQVLEPDPELTEKIASMLASAERPLLWAGGGVVSAGASASLTTLAELLCCPVLTSANGRGAIDETHPLCLGPASSTEEMEQVLGASDLVVAIGTRFQAAATWQWDLRVPKHLVHIDADPSVIGRNYKPQLYMAADAGASLEAIRLWLDKQGVARRDPTAFVARAQEAGERVRAQLRDEIGKDHAAIMDTMRELLPRMSPIVRDATVPAYRWGDRLIPILEPRTSMRPTSAAIGPGLALAIGAAVGSGQPVALIQGDGGLMLSVGEISTAVQHELPIVMCVFNDRGYGVLRSIQERTFGRRAGVDLATPDFAALALAMGAHGETVVGVEQFGPAFSRALSHRGPTVLDIDMSVLEPMSVGTWGRRSST